MSLVIFYNHGRVFILLFLRRLLLPSGVISKLDIIPAHITTFKIAVVITSRRRVLYFGIPGAG